MKHQIMDSFSKLSFTKMENQASHTFNWLDIISFIENHQVKKKKIGDRKFDQSRHWELGTWLIICAHLIILKGQFRFGAL